MITRRGFLGGLVSAALFDRLYGAAEGDPLIRFGFVSDAHLCVMTPEAETALRKAFERFTAANVDAVVVSGDLLDIEDNGTAMKLRTSINESTSEKLCSATALSSTAKSARMLSRRPGVGSSGCFTQRGRA